MEVEGDAKDYKHLIILIDWSELIFESSSPCTVSLILSSFRSFVITSSLSYKMKEFFWAIKTNQFK